MANCEKIKDQEVNYASIKRKVEGFVEHLRTTKKLLERLLSEYQSFSTSEDEFKRVFECLQTLDEVQGYLINKTNSIAVMFPLNMPLYGLVLYGIFPALVANTVTIRPPQKMTSLVQKLTPILDLPSFFPNISFVFESRENFVSNYVSSADITIFTGKLENAQHVMKQTKPNSLFLFNGWGCNPIVVGTRSNLKDAARKTVDARLFSSGQDCAAPDAIFVHEDQSAEFLSELRSELRSAKIGDYQDPEVRVGPITDKYHVQEISKLLVKHSAHITYGGTIDYRNSTVHPTIIHSQLSESMNFMELFAPVFFVSSYKSDEELATYFEHPNYVMNEMYVSLFGRNNYVEGLKRSIIIKDQVVFDIDRGNDEFGGYSVGASFVAANKNIEARPVLIPRDISDYLVSEISSRYCAPTDQKKMARQIRKHIMRTFDGTLAFGFVFGNTPRISAPGTSNINVMVVINDLIPYQQEQFHQSMAIVYNKAGVDFEPLRSILIMRLVELETAMFGLETEPCFARYSSSQPDNNRWLAALSSRQRGFTGDRPLLVRYIQRALAITQLQAASRLNNHQGDVERPFLQETLGGDYAKVVASGTGLMYIESGCETKKESLTEPCAPIECQAVDLFPVRQYSLLSHLYATLA